MTRPAGDHNVTVRRPCPLLTVSRTSVLSLPWENQCRVCASQGTWDGPCTGGLGLHRYGEGWGSFFLSVISGGTVASPPQTGAKR